MRTSRMRWLTLALPLGLLAASCGGDDDADTADTVVTDDTTGGTDTTTGDTTGGTDTTTGDTTGGADTTAAPPSSDFEGLVYDESALCGTEGYTGNLAKLEAVDELTVKFTLCAPGRGVAQQGGVLVIADPAAGVHRLDRRHRATSSNSRSAPARTSSRRGSAAARSCSTANEDYWGDAAQGADRGVPLVGRRRPSAWSSCSPARSTASTTSAPSDFATVQNDSNLQLIERDPLNVFYLGFNVDKAPFDNEALRQAIGYAIDKQRLVDNFYPAGSLPATQFLPPGIPQYDDGAETFTADQEQATCAADRGRLSRRARHHAVATATSCAATCPSRRWWPATSRAQLAEVGINVTLDEQESGTFIDNANSGNLRLLHARLGCRLPGRHELLRLPLRGRRLAAVRHRLPRDPRDPHRGGQHGRPGRRATTLYAQANELLFQHAPMIPIAYGGSALAYKAAVEGAHASPLSNESLAAMGVPDQDQFMFLQNGEPSGLYCADETDGEALRVCEQIGESLLAYEVGGTEVVESLADRVGEQRRPDRVDVHAASRRHVPRRLHVRRQRRRAELPRPVGRRRPAHVGREGTFTYWGALFGGFLNPPPAEG